MMSFARSSRVVFSFGVVSLLTLLAVPAHAVTIDLVPVGNAGNANDPATGNLYGGVAYDYQIGKYDVTIGQYAEFLNAVAATDTNSLFNNDMMYEENIRGISAPGYFGSFSYSVMAVSGSAPYGGVSAANRPITYVSWWDSARFANWMANGQPTGNQNSHTTENGAYDLANWTSGTAPARNVTNPNTGAAPTFFIPTNNEWYKAAYYSPLLHSGSGGYYTYATQSNATPGNVIGSGSNQANYNNYGPLSVTQLGYSGGAFSQTLGVQNYLTDVGAFTNSASFYGTFDQSGNVYQWNDLDGTASSSRGQQGGDFILLPTYLSAHAGYTAAPSDESYSVGFRLASPVAVPEPSTWVMGLAGIACGGWQMWRRRRAR